MTKIIINNIPVYGDFSEDVVQLQKRLTELGFPPKGEADGIFGINTKNALILFQQENGLLGYGVVGPKTLKLLNFEVSNTTFDGVNLITSDLKAKKNRHLHPNMRKRLEKILFPNGEIPNYWIEEDLKKVCLEVQRALAFLGVKENGRDNYGIEVGEVQGTIGDRYKYGGNGDLWCLHFAQMKVAFIEDFYKIESPVPASISCVNAWKGAVKISGLTTQTPTIGTLALAQYINDKEHGHAMECYEILSDAKMKTVEGNTSPTDMTNGSHSGFNIRDVWLNNNNRLQTLGFVYVYPNNVIQ